MQSKFLSIAIGLLAFVFLNTAHAVVFYYNNTIQVNASTPGPAQYSSTGTSFVVTGFDMTAISGGGNSGNFAWLTNSTDNSSSFNLNDGSTFTFSGNYSLASGNGSPSFGIYLISGGNASLFLMNSTNLRYSSNVTGSGYYTGGAGTLSVVGSAVPGLNNSFSLQYTPGSSPSLIFTLGGISYDLGSLGGYTIPDWNDISIGFRFYNASTSLTLTNLNYSIGAIPEPSTCSLLAISGLAGISLLCLRRKKYQQTL